MKKNKLDCSSNTMASLYSPHIDENQRPEDNEYYKQLQTYFEQGGLGNTIDKLRAFPKHVPLDEINRFLAKNEIYKKIIDVHGSVVECGVFQGGGLMSWASFSAIYEPLNHTRKIIGFDTFNGFSEVGVEDFSDHQKQVGDYRCDSHDDITQATKIFDIYRPLGHIPKVELIKGDATETIRNYLSENQHLVVALLYLDFDLYKPTKVALELLRPRMPRGAIIAFDELNLKQWPGEAKAVADSLGIDNLKIKRFSFQPQISYAVI